MFPIRYKTSCPELVLDTDFDPIEFGDKSVSLADIPGWVGNTLRLMDGKSGGKPITDLETQPKWAETLYGKMQGLQNEPDGFGEVYDLSEVSSVGTLGYSSDAGILAVSPPENEGDPWKVSYAGSQDQEKQLVDEHNQAGKPKPEPVKPTQPKQAVSSKLKSVMDEMGFDSPEQRRDFVGLVNDVWTQKNDEVQRHNEFLNDAYSRKSGQRDSRQQAAGRERSVQSQLKNIANDPNKDYSHISGWDELTDDLMRQYPEQFSSAADPYQHLMDTMIEGRKQQFSKHSDEVINEALGIVEDMGGEWKPARELQPAGPTDDPFGDGIPFKKQGFKHRYYCWARRNPRRYSLYCELRGSVTRK